MHVEKKLRDREREREDGLVFEGKKGSGMEARVDGANPAVHISTSDASTHHCRHHGSSDVAFLLYRLQVTDAPNNHQLQVYSLLIAFAAHRCDAHDHQVRQDCDSCPDNKD